MYPRNSRTSHLAMFFGLLLVGLAISGSLPGVSEAAVGGCRADPVVILSDGTILDITADIGTSVSDVREIHYVVHGPRNTALVAAISTPTLGFRGKETFIYYADAAPKQYITETVVQTIDDHVAVTAHTTFANTSIGWNTLLTLQYKPINGFNNQILRALLER